MNTIFVDPVIVLIPSDDANREDVEAWLSHLKIWLQEALGAHYKWLHFVQATNLLEDHECFPSFQVIRSLQRKYKLDINPSLLARDINLFFRDETLDFTGNLERLGYLVEVQDGTILIRPEAFVSRWPDYIQAEMQHVLTTACICKHTGDLFGEKLRIATLKLPDNERNIEISATITDALPDGVMDGKPDILQTFPLLFTPDDLLPLLDILALWQEGESGICYAIEQQFKKDWGHTVSHAMSFCLGSHFIDSLDVPGVDNNVLVKLVRIASAVIADTAMDIKCNLRHLRESKAADSPQRTRVADGAKAWRLTLTDKGIGWRMHYWRVPVENGSRIEFANVLKKHDPEEIW